MMHDHNHNGSVNNWMKNYYGDVANAWPMLSLSKSPSSFSSDEVA